MRQTGTLVTLLAGIALVTGLSLAGTVGGLRVNLSPSAPLGLWQLLELTEPLSVGQRVFVCLPVQPWVQEAMERGYLRGGLCAGGSAPLIKTIAGLAGQRVDTSSQVSIAGVPLMGSKIRRSDGDGRRLPVYTGGIIEPGQVYLHSDAAGSFDSRYFGPVPSGTIQGRAVQVLTWP